MDSWIHGFENRIFDYLLGDWSLLSKMSSLLERLALSRGISNFGTASMTPDLTRLWMAWFRRFRLNAMEPIICEGSLLYRSSWLLSSTICIADWTSAKDPFAMRPATPTGRVIESYLTRVWVSVRQFRNDLVLRLPLALPSTWHFP